ncbi:MAG: 3'(2'),5'-bisphosphate nucleotidase CysQ [Bacteroidota bacterium]
MLDLALKAARAGGDAILPFVGQPVPVDYKSDDSPLTKADLASHHAIVAVLEAEAPDIPILSEEGDPESLDRSGWTRFWCIDPLDGTKEFVKGSGEFTVNVALIEDGTPVMGVVHVPVKDVTYLGDSDGAFKIEDGEKRPMSTREVPEGALTVVASRDHAGPEIAEAIARIEASGRTVEAASMGSSLKFCLVAEGAADLYPRTGPTMEWDTAAAHAVLYAAGGKLVALTGEYAGNPLPYNRENLRNPPVVAWGDPSLEWQPWLDGLV